MPQLTVGSNLNPARLAQRFDRLHRVVGRFAAFSRENYRDWAGVNVKAIGDVDNPTPSGALIESWTDTASKDGGDDIRVPVIGHLSQGPVGDTEAEGLGETMPFTFRKLKLTYIRKVLAKATKMNAQKLNTQLLAAVNNEKSALLDWWGRWIDGNIQHTLLTGYDVMLTGYRTIKGQITDNVAFSPPNFYIAKQGKVSYTNGRPTAQGYETEAIDKLNAIVGNTTAGFSTDLVLYCQQDALDGGIPQWQTPWGEYTMWFIDSWQAFQLKNDPKFRADTQFAWMGQTTKNPLINNKILVWEGNLFTVIPGMFGVQTSGQQIATNTKSLTMPAYGPSATMWISNTGGVVDNNAIKIAHILAPGALHKLYGRNKVDFKDQTGDFERRHEVVMEVYQALVRGDLFDERNDYGNGAGAFFQNQVQYSVATYSPRPANV